MGITPEAITPGDSDARLLLTSDYCPAESKALMIAGILSSNWQFFKDRFKAAEAGELVADDYYWYDDHDDYMVYRHWYSIKLNTGERESWDYAWRSPYMHALLKVDWLDD